MTCLAANAIVAILDVGNTTFDLDLLGRTEGISSLILEGELERAAARRALLYYATLGAMALAAVVFLPWFFRAYRNLAALEAPHRSTPGWAVIGWFIPFGNFYLPYRSMQEIWKGAGNPGSTWTVFAWWTSWLSAALLERLSGLALRDGRLDDATALHLGGAALAALSAIVCVVLIRSISKGQERLWAKRT